jgi:hypothetical protein
MLMPLLQILSPLLARSVIHLSYQYYNRTGRRFPDRPLPPPQRRALVVRLLVLAALLAVAYALAPR